MLHDMIRTERPEVFFIIWNFLAIESVKPNGLAARIPVISLVLKTV